MGKNRLNLFFRRWLSECFYRFALRVIRQNVLLLRLRSFTWFSVWIRREWGHIRLYISVFDLWTFLVRVVVVFDQFIQTFVYEIDQVLTVVETQPYELKSIPFAIFLTFVSNQIRLFVWIVHFDAYQEKISQVKLQNLLQILQKILIRGLRRCWVNEQKPNILFKCIKTNLLTFES